jgi:hypothetical protein
MEHSEAQQSEFERAFAVRQRRQIILAIPLVVMVLAVGSGVAENEQAQTLFGMPRELAGPGFFGLVLAALAFSVWNWRCPACNKYLGKSLHPARCHACGIALR